MKRYEDRDPATMCWGDACLRESESGEWVRYDDAIARIAELEKENYNLRHSITQAIDPRRGDVKNVETNP
jgi:hypothetical protein